MGLVLRKVFGVTDTSRLFFDVRVFCPLSSYYQSKSLQQCYKDNEALKKRKYEQRIREVEHGCFSPLIFSISGGCGPASTLFIKRLAMLHSEKFQRPYSDTINFIRYRYSFAILKSAIRCLHGSRSKMKLFDSNDFSIRCSPLSIITHSIYLNNFSFLYSSH